MSTHQSSPAGLHAERKIALVGRWEGVGVGAGSGRGQGRCSTCYFVGPSDK